MVEEGLRPGVEDGDKADICAEVFGICSEFLEGFRSGFEEDVVDGVLVWQGERSELFR